MNIVRKDFPGHYEGGQEILLPNFLLPSFESGSLELRLCGAGDFEPTRIITRAALRGAAGTDLTVLMR
jgi:hypothetical protein